MSMPTIWNSLVPLDYRIQLLHESLMQASIWMYPLWKKFHKPERRRSIRCHSTDEDMDMSSRRKRIKLNPQDYQEKNANAHIHITVQVPRSPQGFIVQNAKNKFPSLVAPTSQHVTIPVKATQKHLFQVSPTNSTSTMNITMTISVDNCNEMDEQDEGKDDRSEMSELTNNTRSTNGDISEEEEDIDDDADDDDDTGSQCSNSMSHTDLKSSQ